MGHLKNAFSVFIFLSLASSNAYKIPPNYNCRSTTCPKGGPKIRFPFHLQGTPQHDERCSYPGYEVSCNGKDTVLRLRSFNGPPAVVRKIDYRSQILHVVSTNGCIERLLWDLDLSSSPFQYDHDPHPSYSDKFSNSTFVNCSAGVEALRSYRIDCMSDSEHDVLLVPTDMSIDRLSLSCQCTKTVAVPWSYYIDYWDTNYAVLSWSMPGCKGCDEAKGGICGFKDRAHTNQTTCFDNFHHHSKVISDRPTIFFSFHR